MMVEQPDTLGERGPWAGAPPSFLITCQMLTRGFFHTCPHAQTYEAYSTKLKCTVWIPLPCKQWSCRFCAEDKIETLARKCEKAKPNRLLTLTVDPSRWESPRGAFDGTRRQVPELIRQLRRKFGDIEYLKVTELTARGWPHYHLLVRSAFLPHAVVKDKWCELTGAIIVDLRRVKDRFQTYVYLVKYLSKMHKLEWTKRHVSYSRAFFPQTDRKREDPLGLTEGTVLETHPATLAYHQFRHSTLVEIRYGVYTLNPPADLVRAYTGTDDFAEPTPEPRVECPDPNPGPDRASTPPTPTLFDKSPSPGRVLKD